MFEDGAVGSHIFDLFNRVNDFVGNQYYFFFTIKRYYQEKLFRPENQQKRLL